MVSPIYEALKKVVALINEILEARRKLEKTGFDINTREC
jgi:hypothetical protein